MVGRNGLSWVVVFAACLCASAKPLSAQPLTPLTDYLALPAERRTPTYPMIRCAGLFFAVRDFGGASLRPDMLRDIQGSVTLLVRVAVFVRVAETGRGVEDHLQTVMGSVNRIAAIYQSRLRENFDRTGEAWGNDPLVLSDLTECGTIARTVGEALPELRP